MNLRFPSAGESSGSLARAFAAGVCCIVPETGAYAELPCEAALHLPLAGAVPELARMLVALAADPGRAAAVGEAGRRHAQAEMALPAVAARYRAAIEESLGRPVASPPAGPPPLLRLEAGPGLGPDTVAAALKGGGGPCRLLLAAPDLAALAELTLERPGLAVALLPPWARLAATRVVAEPGRTGLLLDLDLGWGG